MQSPEGTKRIELPKDTFLGNLYDKVYAEFKIDGSHHVEWSLFTDRNKQAQIPNSKRTPLTSVVNHGDMIYLMPSAANQAAQNQVASDLSRIEEDEVDLELAKQHGKITRDRDEQLY